MLGESPPRRMRRTLPRPPGPFAQTTCTSPATSAIVPIDFLFTVADQTVYLPTGMGPTSTAINTSGLYDLTYLPTIGYYVTEDEKSETHTYFAATVYVTAPTGNYDTAKPVNFGENRWRLQPLPHRRAAIRQGVHLRGQRKRRDLHVELEVQHRDGARDHEEEPTFGFEAHLGADSGSTWFAGSILLSGGRRPANAGLAEDSGRGESTDHANDALHLWHPHREALDAPSSALFKTSRSRGRRANHPLPRRPLQPLDTFFDGHGRPRRARLVSLQRARDGRRTPGGRRSTRAASRAARARAHGAGGGGILRRVRDGRDARRHVEEEKLERLFLCGEISLWARPAVLASVRLPVARGWLSIPPHETNSIAATPDANRNCVLDVRVIGTPLAGAAPGHRATGFF